DNFPPALRYELGTDGTITDHPVTVLGPDLRDSGDGKSLGLAKVIAGVNEAVTQAEKYNVPRTATLALLDKAEGMFDDMARYGRPTPELRYRRAWMLIEFARNYQLLGDTGKQLARANEAHRLLAGLAAEKPDDISYQRDLWVAYNEVGDV